MNRKKIFSYFGLVGSLCTTIHAQIDSGLIGYWEFENDLIDSSGAHAAGTHDGAAEGTIAYAAGPDTAFGQGLDLTGAGGVKINNTQNGEAGYVDTFDAAINSGAGFSISFWAQGLPGNWNPWLSKRGETGEGFQVRRHSSNGSPTFTLRGTAGTDDPLGVSNISSGQPKWIHFLGTWDSSTGERKLYVDGVEDTGVAQTGDISEGGPGNAPAYWLTIGMRHNNADPTIFGNFFSGQIDDVAIWNRPLSASEIVLLSANPLSVAVTLVDTDGDGLSDTDELTIHNTSPTDPDTDDDGVDDFTEVSKGSDPVNDNDFDLDGLTNLEETSGSENPFTGLTLGATPGDTTDWCNPDSDYDGILDGEEVVAGSDLFVTNPNASDTDGDGFADSAEISVASPSDPTDDQSTPTEWVRGLCGYWRFENDLTDSGFVGADGTLLADGLTTETYATGQFGQSIDLDKTNEQVIEITGVDENVFDNVGGDLTVSAWVTVEGFNTNWQAVIAKGEGTSWRMARQTDALGLGFAGGTPTDVPLDVATANLFPIDDGNWHHIVGVAIDGVSYSIWVDGVLVETRTDVLPGITDSDFPLWLGGNAQRPGRSWNGNLDDIAVWKRALSDEEVLELFNNGNELQFLIDNDVTPSPLPSGDVTIDSCGFNAGDFEVAVSGMDSTKTYQMMISVLLDGSDLTEVGSTFTGAASHTFVDDAPPTGKAFYQIFEVVPE